MDGFSSLFYLHTPRPIASFSGTPFSLYSAGFPTRFGFISLSLADAFKPTGSRFLIAVHAVQMSRNREIRQTPKAQVSEIERASAKYGVKTFSRLEPFA